MMGSQLGRTRDNIVNRLIGYSPRDVADGVEGSLSRIEDRQNAVEARLDQIQKLLDHTRAVNDRIDRRLLAEIESVRSARDDIESARHALSVVRDSPEYEAVFENAEPLISVRIPSFRKTDELIDVAIASVLNQTYQNFEIVIVNDGPNEKTRMALSAIGDPRIRYVEFPEQNYYPADPHLRWMVAGVPGANLAAEMARGDWIAPLDDDDEFTPDHLEKLVAVALHERAELAYGATRQVHLTHRTENRIWSYPPKINQFSFLGAIYMKAIGFFQYDGESWRVDEPSDWNLIRRMTRAGVRMAAIEDVVGTMYSISYTHKDEL